MTTRYIVNDVEAAIEFYTGLLGFDLKQQAGAAFAIVQRDDLALMLTGPAASAQRPMPDGSQPTPGGWNRILVEVEDIAATVAAMRSECRRNVPQRHHVWQVWPDDPRRGLLRKPR